MGLNAIAIELDQGSLFKNQQFKHPEFEELKECSTKEEFLEVADADSSYCETEESTVMGYKVVAPFILHEAVSVDSNNPDALDIIPLIIRKGEEIDEELGNNQASTLAESIPTMLYTGGMQKIEEVDYEIHPDDTEVQDYSRKRHEECVLPPPEARNSVQRESEQVLVETLTRQNEVTERQSSILTAHFQRIAEKEAAKSNRFAKLPAPTQNMIRMASSTDGERPTDPSEEALKFYNADSEGRADTVFIQKMSELGSDTVEVSQSTTSVLYNGFFLYNNRMDPSNLSLFNFTLQEPTRGAMLHIIATQGKRKTANEIKASMKQSIVIPEDFD